MIERPEDGIWIVFLVLIAAITGAIGGCAGAAHIFLSQEKRIRFMQVVAYGVLGMFLGMMSIGLLSVSSYYGFVGFQSVEALIGFSLAFGFLGSLLLSGTNVILRWTTKYLGDWEIKFTARQNTEERRGKKR